MALIKCPECEQSVSDKASKCPKCGYPIQEYLSSKPEDSEAESDNALFENEENSADVQQAATQNKNKKKLAIILLATCVTVVALGLVFGLSSSAQRITVEDITLSKWRLTDSSDYGDSYEGTITSEQEKPFIAVIGRYNNEESAPEFVYMEDGKGIIETYEDTDKDPSIKYRAIGYLGGSSIDISNIKVKYKDSDYYDWSYSESTNCSVFISFDMNNSKNGLLVFDVINETNNDVEKNMMAVVINGKAEYGYYAELPYKARGIDISVVPKLFCESDAIKQEDYVIEKAYTAERNDGEYYTSYSGEETLAFTDYADGFVLYQRELVEGGNKESRNVVRNLHAFLRGGECTLTTYDSAGEDETILMPKYEFNIIGYITWTPLEKETI